MPRAHQLLSAPICSLGRAVSQGKLRQNNGIDGAPSGHGPPLKTILSGMVDSLLGLPPLRLELIARVNPSVEPLAPPLGEFLIIC